MLRKIIIANIKTKAKRILRFKKNQKMIQFKQFMTKEVNLTINLIYKRTYTLIEPILKNNPSNKERKKYSSKNGEENYGPNKN